MDKRRYRVRPSDTGHMGLSWMVIDTSKVDEFAPWICLCYSLSDAESIADAMNSDEGRRDAKPL